jgi:hypothetical protein
MVLAEKLVTAIDRGQANTRWRDFADVYVLTQAHPVDANDLGGPVMNHPARLRCGPVSRPFDLHVSHRRGGLILGPGAVDDALGRFGGGGGPTGACQRPWVGVGCPGLSCDHLISLKLALAEPDDPQFHDLVAHPTSCGS